MPETVEVAMPQTVAHRPTPGPHPLPSTPPAPGTGPDHGPGLGPAPEPFPAPPVAQPSEPGPAAAPEADAASEPARPASTADENVRPYLDGLEQILADVSRTGRKLRRDEITSRRRLGAQAAEDGHGWRGLIRAHLAAARAGWPAGADHERVMAAVEEAVDAFAGGYQHAQRLIVRKEEAARREFIDDLLLGRGDPGQLAARSERHGLRLSRAHSVAVVQGPEAYDETDPVPRRVADELFAVYGSRRILLTTKDGRMVCIAPSTEEDVLTRFAKLAHAATGGRIALGRPRPGVVGIGHSYEEALNALDVAQRMGFDEPFLRASDLLVFPVLARDRQALMDLVHNTLGPLNGARGGARVLLDTLSAYFDAGCVAAATARQLSLSVRALTYRLERIHTLTGVDATDPAQRYTLQTAVIGARLLDWPTRPLSPIGTPD